MLNCATTTTSSSVQFSGLTALSASGIVGTICVFVCRSVYVLLSPSRSASLSRRRRYGRSLVRDTHMCSR